MLTLAALQKRAHSELPYRRFYKTPSVGDHSIELGPEIALVKGHSLAGQETRVLALLSAAHNWPVNPHVLNTNKRSQFVRDMTAQAGASPGAPNGFRHPTAPTAGQGADPNYGIPRWRVIGTDQTMPDLTFRPVMWWRKRLATQMQPGMSPLLTVLILRVYGA